MNANPERGYERMARFHAWHWFGDDYCYDLPLVRSPYVSFFQDTTGSYHCNNFVPFNYHSHNPFKDCENEGPEKQSSGGFFIHKHHHIPGFHFSWDTLSRLGGRLHLFNIY